MLTSMFLILNLKNIIIMLTVFFGTFFMSYFLVTVEREKNKRQFHS